MAVVKEKEKTAVPSRSSRKRPAPAGKPVSASAEKPGKRSIAKEAKAALPSRSRIGKPALGKGKILEKARVPENGPERDKALAERIARCMLDKKGLNVTGLDLREVPGASFDFFVICGASSGPQARAIADEISDKVYLDFREDPLHEDGDSPVPGLTHRYPDRVLFLITDMCSMYCRHCTRRRFAGHRDCAAPKEQIDKCIEYIERTPEVRDVLLSGGDALLVSDERLEYIIKRLRAIPHVEIIRIGSRTPVVLPQRITPELVNMLKKYMMSK